MSVTEINTHFKLCRHDCNLSRNQIHNLNRSPESLNISPCQETVYSDIKSSQLEHKKPKTDLRRYHIRTEGNTKGDYNHILLSVCFWIICTFHSMMSGNWSQLFHCYVPLQGCCTNSTSAALIGQVWASGFSAMLRHLWGHYVAPGITVSTGSLVIQKPRKCRYKPRNGGWPRKLKLQDLKHSIHFSSKS
jgi:hypothetical protein